MSAKKTVGVVGGRGVVGVELMKLLAAHPGVSIAFGEGDRVKPDATGVVDVLFLAAPNGVAAAYAQAAPASTVIVDLSSDHRFDHAWVYGLPERNRARVAGATRISNPGCYATGAQLGIDPFLDVVAPGAVPSVFGVSGYSGAGSTPSPKNDPARLADNLLPYALVDHTHEREIARQIGRPVAFMPHVAPFYVGITLTVTIPIASTSASPSQIGHGHAHGHAHVLSVDEAHARVARRYEGEALVRVQREIPEVRDARGKHGVTIGGITVDAAGSRVALVVTLDNLLKGAATQAVQNMNIALGLPELTGIAVSSGAA